ncbi:hypothetical protein MHK_005189 [Candidatus Magnetomorum sp. HK-1]|nr:hypothetical protein MHK_005189 [Candidatus Magnetomorum sp. HK-1]
MRLTPNAFCQQDKTIVTLVGTDESEEYKTKTFTVLVNDSTSGSCVEPEIGVLRIDDGPVHNYVGANVQVPVLIKIPQGDSNLYDPITSFGFDIVYSDQRLFYIDYETANAAIPFESNGIFTVDSSNKWYLTNSGIHNWSGVFTNQSWRLSGLLKFPGQYASGSV